LSLCTEYGKLLTTNLTPLVWPLVLEKEEEEERREERKRI
jgi:hypothetical protein